MYLEHELCAHTIWRTFWALSPLVPVTSLRGRLSFLCFFVCFKAKVSDSFINFMNLVSPDSEPLNASSLNSHLEWGQDLSPKPFCAPVWTPTVSPPPSPTALPPLLSVPVRTSEQVAFHLYTFYQSQDHIINSQVNKYTYFPKVNLTSYQRNAN